MIPTQLIVLNSNQKRSSESQDILNFNNILKQKKLYKAYHLNQC